MNFAQRIADIPTSLITNQISSITGIKLNELFASSKFRELDLIVIRATTLLLVLLTPVTVLLYIFAEPILIIIFNHGAYKISSVFQTASMLQILILMIPLLAVNSVLSRMFMALHQIKFAFKYQIFVSTLVIALTFLLVRYFNEFGYPLAHVVAYLTSTFVLVWVVGNVAPFLRYKLVLRNFAALTLINGGLLIFALKFSGVATNMFHIIAFGFVYALLYSLILYFSPFRHFLRPPK